MRKSKKLTNKRKRKTRRRIVLLSDYDPINKILQDKIRITKMIVRNRIKFKKPNLIDKFKKHLSVNKKVFNNRFSKKIQCYLKKSKKKQKSFNFIFLYFQLILKLMIDEKRLALIADNIIKDDFALNKIFQFKIKKLIIFKLFLRY